LAFAAVAGWTNPLYVGAGRPMHQLPRRLYWKHERGEARR
jgi:hypothetical protein